MNKANSLEGLKNIGSAIPRESATVDQILATSINVEFQLNHAFPMESFSVAALLEGINRLCNSLPEEAMYRHLQMTQRDLNSTRPSEFLDTVLQKFVFTGGVFISSGEEAIAIERIFFSKGTASVKVRGTDDEAMRVLQAVYDLIMELAGLSKRFRRDFVHARGFTTTSIARMNLGISAACSSNLNAVVQDTFASKITAFKGIGFNRIDNEDDFLESQILAVKMRELSFSITRIDPRNGNTEECFLTFAPHTKTDIDLGDYAVTSEYNNRIHQELVGRIANALSS